MCVQPVLSVASSKRPSGVPAELEWLLLGDTAMAVAFGATRPGHATGVGIFLTLAMPDLLRRLSCPLFILPLSSSRGVNSLWCEDEMWNWFH
jgi:hypothetical protein